VTLGLGWIWLFRLMRVSEDVLVDDAARLAAAPSAAA
jgi:hypothetical protein